MVPYQARNIRIVLNHIDARFHTGIVAGRSEYCVDCNQIETFRCHAARPATPTRGRPTPANGVIADSVGAAAPLHPLCSGFLGPGCLALLLLPAAEGVSASAQFFLR